MTGSNKNCEKISAQGAYRCEMFLDDCGEFEIDGRHYRMQWIKLPVMPDKHLRAKMIVECDLTIRETIKKTGRFPNHVVSVSNESAYYGRVSGDLTNSDKTSYLVSTESFF